MSIIFLFGLHGMAENKGKNVKIMHYNRTAYSQIIRMHIGCFDLAVVVSCALPLPGYQGPWRRVRIGDIGPDMQARSSNSTWVRCPQSCVGQSAVAGV